MVLVTGLVSGAAYAQDASMSVPLSSEQAQARQLGIFFGGTASQYDLCAKKGFLAKVDPSAEDTARSILDKIRALSKGADQSAYVQEGWDMIKKEISEHESYFTQEKCASVGKEWAKILAAARAK
jgi:hypothetical protein